ncbi:hypothetical protein [Glutamicibacter protophormiae]|uniref:Uncharacterized protein (DUF58 family) n=1 Tax=Glutamicibacter protophormiae TaxID=37930 RepID=A0ABS4XRH1_GLUPR|nr:hypothetical protein [Glutamicibacter protophormiae]MBP2398877.1 uncharacterized protein (DUF58 family) [Glutamicibacter protophormiae]GGL83273.1 hypothetical protein GCM10010038_11440 [Glutamicibacter protophormiae]
MSAGTIIARATRRMWLIWMPAIFAVLAVAVMTASMQNGLSVLAIMVAGGLVLMSLGDWFSAELAANRAS